jgi:hypothetical protein
MPQFIKMGLGGTGFMGRPTKHLRAAQKRAANRKVLEGYPITRPFESINEVREYLSGDKIICLLCGKPYRTLNSHLSRIHGVTHDEYRDRYNIPWTYGLVCGDFSETLSGVARRRIASGEWRPGSDDKEFLAALSKKTKRRTPHRDEIMLDAASHRHPPRARSAVLPCRMCGKDVGQPDAGRKFYCDTKCRSAYYEKKRREQAQDIVCALCDDTFTPSYSQSLRAAKALPVYCSFLCRQTANGRRRGTPDAP